MTVFLLSGAGAAVGQDWTVLAQPTTQDLHKLSFVDARRGWAAGDSGCILVTTDGGGSWASQTCPVGDNLVDLTMIDPEVGWALAQHQPAPPTWEYGTTLIRTTDGGADWAVEASFPDLFFHTLAFTGPLSGCLGGEQGKLWWTSDGGLTWTPGVVDSAGSAQWPVRSLTFRTPTDGLATGGLYDVTGVVWRTSDAGQSWAYQRVAGEPLFAAHFFDSSNVLCVGGDLDYGAGMVRTSDAGASWQYTYLGIWGRASALSFRTPTDGWAPLGFAGTIMRTRDGGNRWTAMPTPGGGAMNDVLFADSGTGYMAGAGGTILKYVGEGTSVGVPELGAGASTLALQACPNPFGPATRVDFEVPGSAFVSLRVYDVLGREVARLVDERLPGGTYARSFDGRGLPNGVYFCALTIGSESATRKMLLVK